MMREAHPIEAAERRQYVAPGASPGISALSSVSTVGATDSVSYWLRPVGLAFAPLIGSFAPTGLDLKTTSSPGLRPGLHTVAAPRLNKDAASPRYSIRALMLLQSQSVVTAPGWKQQTAS